MEKTSSTDGMVTHDLYTVRKKYGITLSAILKKTNISRFRLKSMESRKLFPVEEYKQLSSTFPILFPGEKAVMADREQIRKKTP